VANAHVERVQGVQLRVPSGWYRLLIAGDVRRKHTTQKGGKQSSAKVRRSKSVLMAGRPLEPTVGEGVESRGGAEVESPREACRRRVRGTSAVERYSTIRRCATRSWACRCDELHSATLSAQTEVEPRDSHAEMCGAAR
jgi:hypothetical protein